MTINDLKNYGIIRKVYKGKGFAKSSDGRQFKVKLLLAQFIDTQLMFVIEYKGSIQEKFDLSKKITDLIGVLQDGQKVSASGLLTIESKIVYGKNSIEIGYVNEWIIGEFENQEPSLMTFDLVNFRFMGTECQLFIENSIQRPTLSLMTLTIAQKQIKLQWKPDYEKIIAILKAQQGVRVTSSAIVEIINIGEIDSTIEMIDSLCDVMTVARGTLVNWTSFDVKTEDDELIYSKYRNSVTRPYAGIELINSNDNQGTKLFLEKGFVRCKEISSDFQIRKIARSYTETKAGVFLESRALLIGVLVEFISSVRARLDERIYFLDSITFESKWETFRSCEVEILNKIYPEIAKKYLPVILNSIKNLNRRSFSWKINDLAKWLGLKFVGGEVEKFVITRNKLAHEGKFPEEEMPVVHYKRMQHFLDRIMLGLFDYHGDYYDYENNELRKN